MKKRKIKNVVLPAVYVMSIVVSFFSVAILNNLLLGDVINYDYSQSIIEDTTEAVLGEVAEDNKTSKIQKPYTSKNVSEKIMYYSKDDSLEEQQKSLILYENTYMPSTGIFYSSNESFDVVSVADGIIKSIKQDDILGIVVEVAHNTNLTSYYYSLNDVKLNEKDEIKAGTILGQATTNKIFNDQNNFLFEVYYQGKSMDPKKFYELDLNELQ